MSKDNVDNIKENTTKKYYILKDDFNDDEDEAEFNTIKFCIQYQPDPVHTKN